MAERLKVLDELGGEFARVARQGARKTLRRGHVLGLALLATGSVTAGALAASGVLTGEPVRDMPGVTRSPTGGLGTTRIGSARLLSLRTPDPAGGPDWGLRTLTTTRGLGCVQLGRVMGTKLGVLGVDGAFADDGLFHPRPATVTPDNCRQRDGAGQTFLAVTYSGLPTSAQGGSCRTRTRLKGDRSKTPACDRRNLRIVLYGLLGPQARSVTYRDAAGSPQTVRTVGREGAYLIVMRPSASRPATGGFYVLASPGSAITAIGYADGTTCRVRSPKSLGGAKPCPLRGYVAPSGARLGAADVATKVRATVHPALEPLPTGGFPPGVKRERGFQLVIRFRARVRGDGQHYFRFSVTPGQAPKCKFGSFGSITRDVRAGELVTVTNFLPGSCRGTVRGDVRYVQPGPDAAQEQMPFMGQGLNDGVLVGKYAAAIPEP